MSTTPIDNDLIPVGRTIQSIGKMSGGSVKSGGTVHTGLSQVPLPREVDITLDQAQQFLFAGSGSYASSADGNSMFLSDPTEFRKLAEINVANEINDTLGDLNRGLEYREVTTSGLDQLRDGRYIDSNGVIWAHPTGFLAVTPEIVDNLGDTAAKTRSESPQSYFYKMAATDVEKTLPNRN